MNAILLLLSLFVFTIVEGAPGGRIVGGHDADIADYGYQVSVQRDGKHTCGGAILNHHWIITASHCINENPIIKYEVRVDSNKANEKGAVYRVVEIQKHPDFTIIGFDCDVALLRLRDPIRFNGRSVRPINLIGVDQDPPPRTNVTITGWGSLKAGTSMHTEHLQVVSVPTMDWNKCKAIYDAEVQDMFTKHMFCAGFDEGGKDSCQGDSGGPLVNAEKDTLIGIVSWGVDCAKPNKPGVYARLASSAIRSFITKYTGL